MDFLHNIVISIWAFASWYLAGLGPSLLLFPKNQRHKIFLLSPLIGMCLLTLMGGLEISILLIPFTPNFNISILLLCSLFICLLIYRKDFRMAWSVFRRRLIWLWLPILPLILIFAWLFHNGGFHLLVGSSDQLQYCENARQIFEEMHTRSVLDLPVARQEFFVYEMSTHTQPYLKYLRRGAEILLATVKATTGVGYQQAFPITILNALLVLMLGLGFLGRSLRLSNIYCSILQFTFLSSFYLLLLHIQGSLAMLLGMAPGLIALALFAETIKTPSWRWILLTAIVMAGYISIYSEPALFNIFLPTILIIFWQLFCSKINFWGVLRQGTIYLFSFLFAPFAIYSVIFNTLMNTNSVITAFHAVSPAAVTSTLQTWNVGAVVLGTVSYYDTSHINAVWSSCIARSPSIALISFFILSGCGLFGYLKSHYVLPRLLGMPLLFWMLTSLITSQGQDYLRFARSLHYSMPYALIGLVLLANHYKCIFSQHKQVFSFRVMMGISGIVLSLFIAVNIYTTARTIRFITAHNTENDQVLLRFNERAAIWQQLRNELHVSALHSTPVLISGFKDTIRPLALAIIMRSQPHVLGTSILSFWHIYNNANSGELALWPFSEKDFSIYNTRLPLAKLTMRRQQESQPWNRLEPELIMRSEQAVVPIGHGYPVEWGDLKNQQSFRVKRFSNICDVIYRIERRVT